MPSSKTILALVPSNSKDVLPPSNVTPENVSLCARLLSPSRTLDWSTVVKCICCSRLLPLSLCEWLIHIVTLQLKSCNPKFLQSEINKYRNSCTRRLQQQQQQQSQSTRKRPPTRSSPVVSLSTTVRRITPVDVHTLLLADMDLIDKEIIHTLSSSFAMGFYGHTKKCNDHWNQISHIFNTCTQVYSLTFFHHLISSIIANPICAIPTSPVPTLPAPTTTSTNTSSEPDESDDLYYTCACTDDVCKVHTPPSWRAMLLHLIEACISEQSLSTHRSFIDGIFSHRKHAIELICDNTEHNTWLDNNTHRDYTQQTYTETNTWEDIQDYHGRNV